MHIIQKLVIAFAAIGMFGCAQLAPVVDFFKSEPAAHAALKLGVRQATAGLIEKFGAGVVLAHIDELQSVIAGTAEPLTAESLTAIVNGVFPHQSFNEQLLVADLADAFVAAVQYIAPGAEEQLPLESVGEVLSWARSVAVAALAAGK